MARLSFECAALAAALVLVGCGGGKDAEGGTTGAPTSAPAPGPGSAPSPSPSPSPSPAPAPAAPAPAPSAQAMRGALLYKSYCSGCHGDEPESGTQGVYKGLTAEVIQGAIRRVDSMRLLGSVLTAANNADIAAFIESRVRP